MSAAGELQLFTSADLVKHSPILLKLRIVLIHIFTSSYSPFYLIESSSNRVREQLISTSACFGLLVEPPAWSGFSSYSTAAAGRCVAVSGVRPSVGGWRPASTASPLPPVLRVPKFLKVVDPSLKTAVKPIAKLRW